MSNSGKPESLLIEEPREVDVVAIERELSQLWKSAADPVEGEMVAPVVRACSSNLIVVTEQEGAVDRLGNIVGDVSVEHPSRIFLIFADRRSSVSSISSWISARCSLPVPGGKQVCCEQVNLNVRGTDANKIPSIVTSLLVPDVPTVLLWKAVVDDHDQIFTLLSQVADRVVIDSSEERQPAVSALSWHRLISANSNRTTFADLAWRYCAGWRSLLAEVFDPVEVRAGLASIESVVVEYSSVSSPYRSGLGQGILLAGWLAGRLQWSIVHPMKTTPTGECLAKLRREEQAINVSIRRNSEKATEAGAITKVHIHSASGVDVHMQSKREAGCVEVRVLQGERVLSDRIAFLGETSDVSLLSRELDELYRDSLYETSLHSLVKLLGGK